MFITSEDIKIRYNKDNGNDDLASLVSKDFLEEYTKTTWNVLPCSHETKGNFDVVLCDEINFETFEFKSGITLTGELIFNGNQIEDSNKVYGIIFKTKEYIESMIFCQFDISLAVKLGIFLENKGKNGLRYRYKLSRERYNSLVEKHILTSTKGNVKVKILRRYNKDRIQAIIDKANDLRKNLKKLFN